jgi:hypothetical protein
MHGRAAGQIDQYAILPPKTTLRIAEKRLHARVDAVRAEESRFRHCRIGDEVTSRNGSSRVRNSGNLSAAA